MPGKYKLQWLIDEYNKNGKKFDSPFYVDGIERLFGTNCKATGVGKSGDIIKDIVFRIQNSNGKLIINFSEFFLKLSEQLAEDIFGFLIRIGLITEDNCFVYKNSSDNAKNIKAGEIEIRQYKMEDLISDNPGINFVISCNKSLQKLVKDSAGLKKEGFWIINYLDESHTLTLKEVTEAKNKKVVTYSDDSVQVDLTTLCKNSKAVYAISATPDMFITKLLHTFDKNKQTTSDFEYLIYEAPQESIIENKIVAPAFDYLKTEVGARFNAEVLIDLMNKAKEAQPTIPYHKMLVTVKSVNEANDIYDDLVKANKNVFMVTCEGFKTNTLAKQKFSLNRQKDEDDEHITNFEDINILKFTKAVDEFEEDCFVIHIRILVAGIDIKSLTSCVIYANTHNDAKSEFGRHTIQTIGRCLRPLAGERGVPENERKKKFGHVFFLTPIDNPTVEENLRHLVSSYYGFNSIEFIRSGTVGGSKGSTEFENFGNNGSNMTGDEFFDSIYMNAMRDIVAKYKPIIEALEQTGYLKKVAKKEFDKICKDIEKQVGNSNLSVVDWLDNSAVYEIISVHLKNYLTKIKMEGLLK